MGKRLFESRIINPLLSTIAKNIDYLTQKENLPQLAKLGYIYNTLWYKGRECFGSSYGDEYPVLIKELGQCEDNPKYKLEMCDVGTDEQYDFVYDAWGMHVSNDTEEISFEDFKNLILKGKAYSEVEELEQKSEKTMDDWIELFTHKDYKYNRLFPNRKSVLDYLLCTIGTGMDYKDGFIFSTASGADQDVALYSGWENAIFPTHILKVVTKIVEDEDVEKVLTASYERVREYNKKAKLEKKQKQAERKKLYYNYFDKMIRKTDRIEKFMRGGTSEFGSNELLIDSVALNEEVNDMVNKFMNNQIGLDGEEIEEDKTYKQYYPICQYSNITKLDVNSHPSYLKAGLEILKDMYANTWDKSNSEEKSNLDFMKKNMVKFEHWVQGKEVNNSSVIGKFFK